MSFLTVLNTQPELPIFSIPADDSNVAWLVDLLREQKCWMTAKRIIELSGDRLSDRDIRALAEAASGDLLSGQKGYRHISHATPEEIHHAAAWLESQASKMALRAQRIRRRAHQILA